MLTNALNNAISGLRVAQEGIAVTSNNVANASTPGYTRKILPQSNQVTEEGIALGVQAEEVRRQVNTSLQRDFFKQISRSSNLDVKQTFLNQVQNFHGGPDEERSLAAQVGKLRDSFLNLEATPDDSFLLENTFAAARDTSDLLNRSAGLVTTLRNDAQAQMVESVNRINGFIQDIAELNQQIQLAIANGRSAADLEDQRDIAIEGLSEEINISSFTRGDSTVVVQTQQGVLLADENPAELFFDPSPQGPQTLFPDSAAGIRIDDPDTGIDIAAFDLGGKLGGLLELRDQVLPEFNAALDEFAHKLALRFDSQGLRMFTNASGDIPNPLNIAGDPTTDPPTPVGHVGFASSIQVNPAVNNDVTLIRSGTTGNAVEAGSAEVIRKIVEFTFGRDQEITFQSTSTIDLTTVGGTTDLHDVLSLDPVAKLVGDETLREPDATQPVSLFNLGSGQIDDGDVFSIEIITDTTTITDSLTLSSGGTSTVLDLISAIDSAPNILANPDVSIDARLDIDGQLVIESTGGDLRLLDSTVPATQLGVGVAELGVSFGTTVADNPSFSIQLGNGVPQVIEIAPGDTNSDLLTSINAIDNLTATIDTAGQLLISPDNGGDITIQDEFGNPALGGGLEMMRNRVQHVPFFEENLGPLASLETNIISSPTLIEYVQSVIGRQTEVASQNQTRFQNESAFRDTLEQRFLNQSGVNVDEEMGNLLRLENAFGASARVLTTVSELFDELFAAIR